MVLGEGQTWLYLNLQKILLKIKNRSFQLWETSRDFTYVDDIANAVKNFVLKFLNQKKME